MTRFEVLRRLSQGGMAEILLARETVLPGVARQVVLKRVRSGYAGSPEFAEMFRDEARIALRLEHPNIVRTYRLDEWDDQPCLVLEYLRGADLGRLIASGRPVSYEQATAIGIAAAAALHHAHTLCDEEGRPFGIVHRDVSPSNIFLGVDGSVKLLDFGVATAFFRTTSTGQGQLKGKLAYMSPEQCQSEEVDPRSDVFSLGVVLYELTTGRRLFRGGRAVDLVQRIIAAPVEAPTALAPNYPPELERIVLGCLSKAPADRPSSAGELASQLGQLARGMSYSLIPSDLAALASAAQDSAESDDDPRSGDRAVIHDARPAGRRPTHPARVHPAPSEARAAVTILLVDPEELVHRNCKPYLRDYRQLAAYSGWQALGAIAREAVDVILLDLDLPDMSGTEALDLIRHQRAEIPIIAFAGRADLKTAVEAMRRGAFDFLSVDLEGYAAIPEAIRRALVEGITLSS
jgi:serine/threonine protein kinase